MTVSAKLVRNISANYIGVAGQLLVAFLLTPFLIHSLGDERYGVWSIIAAFTGYLMLFDLGVVSAITKYTAEYRAKGDQHRLNRLVGSAAVIVLPVTAMLIALSPMLGHLLVSVLSIDPALHPVVRISALLATLEVAVFVMSGLYRGLLFGNSRYDLTNLIQLVTLIIRATLLYAVLSYGHGLVGMSIVTLASVCLLSLAMWWAVRRTDPHTHVSLRKANKEDVGRVATFSRATFMSMIAAQVIYYSDAFVIGYFLSAAAVTYYTIAWSLTEYTNRLMVVASKVFIPLFSEVASRSEPEKLYETFINATRYQLIVSNLVCTCVFVMGHSFLSLWVGESYADISGPLLTILFVSQAVRGPQLISYALLQATAQHQFYARLDLLFAALNLILGLALIQRYGLTGIAAATAATQFAFHATIVPTLTLRSMQRSLLNYLARTQLPLVIPTALLAVVLLILRHYLPIQSYWHFFLHGIVGAAVYFIAVWYVSLSKKERTFVLHKSLSLLKTTQQLPEHR